MYVLNGTGLVICNIYSVIVIHGVCIYGEQCIIHCQFYLCNNFSSYYVFYIHTIKEKKERHKIEEEINGRTN